jgi:hypothetical protein
MWCFITDTEFECHPTETAGIDVSAMDREERAMKTRVSKLHSTNGGFLPMFSVGEHVAIQ